MPRRRQRRLPRQQQPDAIRLSYAGLIRGVLRAAVKLVNTAVVPHLDSATHQDSAAAAHAQVMRAARAFRHTLDLQQKTLERGARQIGERTERFQKQQLERQLAAVGVEAPIQDRGVQARVDEFTTRNVALIRSVPEQYFEQVQAVVQEMGNAGARAEDIAKELVVRAGVAESRAYLIANDQVGKLAGAMNQVRQQDLGITHFVWRDSNDNRVREEHQALDGQAFPWASPPADGIPGEPVACRCTAEPDLSALMA